MIKKSPDEYRADLTELAIAFNKVFDRDDSYTQIVLKHLAWFCRAHKTTFLPDARAHAVLEGRREVWLEIQEYLNLSIDELYDLHKVKEYIPKRRVDGSEGQTKKEQN